MPDTNTNPDTDTDADDDAEQDLKQRVKAHLLAAYAYVAGALAQSAEEIAPQLRGLSLPGVSSRAAKSLLLAGVLITAAVAMPADPFGGGEATVERQDPVQGETYEPEPDAPSLNGATLNSLPDSFTGSEADAPDPPEQVRASAGSQTMSVETAVVDGEPAIVLEDDRTHDGRWVSIDTSWFQQHLGEVPSAAYIDHETEGSYASTINVRGDSAAFYVREFSTNTVTFDGEISLSGSQAGDGSQFEYELGNTTDVDDPSINLTGVENTAPASTSAIRADGESLTADVGGTTTPQDETVTLTGRETRSSWTGSGTGYGSVTVDGNQPAEDISVTLEGSVSTADNSASGSDSTGSSSTSISVGGNLDPTGPANGDPEVSVSTAKGTSRLYSASDSGDIQLGYDESESFSVSGGQISEVTVDAQSAGGSTETAASRYDIIVDGETVASGLDPYNSPTTATFSSRSVSQVTILVTNSFDGGDLLLDATDDHYVDIGGTPEDISVSADGGGGSVNVGTGGTTALPLTTSTSTISTSHSGPGSTSWDLTYTEHTATEDPALDLNGDGGDEIAHTGVLAPGETTTISASDGDLNSGSNSIDASTTTGPLPSWTIDATAVTATEDPSVTVDGSTVSHTGILANGETVTKTVDLSTGSNTIDVSTGGEVGVEASWTEVTQTRDPVVELNGETVGVDGTLADGETVSLSQNASALREGTNTVNISTNSPSSGPASLVGFEYSHGAETTVDATVSETTWSQSTNVSRTWPSARSNATATIPMNDRVVDVRNVELRINGTTWETVPESDYTLNGTDLTVQLGDVGAGSTTEVRATGSKVRVTDGAITVLEPTTGSETLDTRIQVDDAGPDFALSVDETVFGDRVHYADNATWGATGGETTITADGGQTLTLPNATAGAEASVRTWPIEVAPTTGQVTVSELAGERSEPGIAVRGDGNSEVDYTFVNAEDATPYILYSETNGIVRDEGLASSPITLTDDNSDETLVFLVDEGSASGSGSGSTSSTGPGGTGPMVSAGGSVLAQLQGIVPSGQTLLLGVGLIGGLFVVGRRSGVITEERQQAATSAATSAAGTAGGLVERALDNEIVVGALILGAGAFILGTGVLPGDARLIVGLGTAPVGVYLALQQFGQFDFRVWLGSTIVIALLGMNVLAPTFFETIAQEAGILLALGGVYLGYRLISAFRAEAETPDEQTNVTFEVDDDGGN